MALFNSAFTLLREFGNDTGLPTSLYLLQLIIIRDPLPFNEIKNYLYYLWIGVGLSAILTLKLLAESSKFSSKDQ